MTTEELQNLIDRSLFADLGYTGGDGRPAIRRVFCVWHRGLGRHLISTNTSSGHVGRLTEDSSACLYFADSETFEGVCLTGRAVPTRDQALRRLLWNDGDEKYYPLGVDDPDYCVIEFTAERADYYRYDGKGTLDAATLAELSAGKAYENGYLRTHPQTEFRQDDEGKGDSEGTPMNGIERYDISEEWAHSGIIRAGSLCFIGYCVGNIGQDIEAQVNGAIDHLERRLATVGLTLENVVQMDCLFRDVWNIPVMEKVIKQRFNGKYPVRKSIQTEFAHVGGPDGLLFQLDAIACAGDARG